MIITTHERDANDLIGTYFHEATHYSDTILIADWIKANLKLKKEGRLPDPLFSKITIILKNKVHVDSGFLTAFFESRAATAQMEAISATGTLVTRNYYRKLAMHYIQPSNKKLNIPTPESMIEEEFGITKQNILELGTQWGADMEITIKRANQLDHTPHH